MILILKQILVGLLILLVCVLAYGKIVGMHFFLEDYLILYSIQHPNSPEAGYGSGIFGRPYGYAVTPFIPFYYLFQLEPRGYYIVEIFLYFLAALSVYFLAKTLTGNKKAALGSALVFASGYVGSTALYRMAVGWQNILAAIFISLSAAFYYKYIKNSTFRNYLLAFGIYLFTSEFSFYRAHGIIIIILGLEVLFNFKPFKSLIRMVPFIASYWYFYVYSIRDFMNQGSKVSSLINIIFNQKNYSYLLTPLKTLENLFVPDKFYVPLFVFLALLASILIWKRSKALLYCLVFAVSNYLVHFYVSPGASPETNHRYLTVSFVGAAAFWGIFLSEVFRNKYKYLFFCALIVAVNLTLVGKEQKDLFFSRSQPSSKFWQDMQQQLQSLPKNSAIYIDSKNDGVSRPARDVAVGAGSMSPTTSFAVYYGLDWEDIYLAENFSELLEFVKKGQVPPKNIYTFFYSRDGGLVNTTEMTKAALSETKPPVEVESLDNVNHNYSTPLLLSFSSKINADFSNLEYPKEDGVSLSKYLQFLSSRKNYYDTVSAASTTQVRYAEIKNIWDGNTETSWRADDLSWANSRKEEVVLSLGEEKHIGGMKMMPANAARVPTKYTYECSSDQALWRPLASFEKEIKKATAFIDKFEGASCALIKLTIFATASGGPPQISEIEAIESKFSDIDLDIAEKLENNPFLFIKSPDDIQLLSNYFAQNGVSGNICVYTNKYKTGQAVCKKHKFELGSGPKNSFFVDQSGTLLNKIELKLPPRVRAEISNIRLEYLTYQQLDKRGYIIDHR